MDWRAMTVLSTGHAATDFAGGVLPALLPFLHDKFHLTYTLSAVLILASAISSSVIQPLFGLWSDRRGALWLLPTGVALAGIGMALAADAPSYWLVILLVVVSGIGTAAYHPEGSKFAAYVSGEKKATGMAFFSIGGNLGYALGPVAATGLAAWFGLRGELLVAIPCLAVAAALFVLIPYLRGFAPEARRSRIEAGENRLGAMGVLVSMIAFRSLAWFGLITFVPLWDVAQGHSKSYGGRELAIMLFAGGVGTLALGPIADRFGSRAVLIATQAFVGPLVLAYIWVGGIPGTIALSLVAACVVGTFGVTMVMSQEYLPRNIGMASGLTIGLSIGLGGLAAVILGSIADTVSLRTALYVIAAAPVAGLLLASGLPRAPVGSRRISEEDATWQTV
jgi:FSR family fosmidomycin resistance protein-like MFS transporter